MTGLGTRVYLLKINDYNEPMTIASAFERVAKYSGIFDVQVSSAYVTSVTSIGASSVAFDWTTTFMTTTSFQNGVEVTADILASNPFGISVLSRCTTGKHYMVGRNSANRFFVMRKDGNTEVTVNQSAGTHPAAGTVRIAARLMQFDGNETDENTWASISIWWNGDLLLTAHDQLQWSYKDSNDMLVGYARYRNTPAHFQNLTITQLHPFINTIVIDPGESSMQGLQRAISGYDVTYWIRPTGQLKVVRPSPRATVMVIPDSRIVSGRSWAFDFRVPQALRLTGGYSEINSQKIHPLDYYTIINNTFFTQQSEIEIERYVIFNEMTSSRDRITFSMPANVLLEVNDKINVNNNDWLIESIDYEFRSTSIIQTITARLYTYG